MKGLAKEIIEGRRLGRQEDLSFFINCNLEELCAGADEIRKSVHGNKVDLCSIVNGRSGGCGEDCKFCAQSRYHNTDIEEYKLMDLKDIIHEGLHNEASGVHRYSVVTAGGSIKGKQLEHVLNAYRYLHQNSKLKLCASHGLQTLEEFKQMKEAGVERYHANIETSRRYFQFICTTHTYEDKISNIQRAKKAGLDVCSGGIIGMGETWEDRLDMAVSLAELEIGSIPLNILRPIPGTPFEHLPAISNDDVKRTVAFFRYINPDAWIRIAAGRGQFDNGGAELFESGADAAITGDMLTTTGTSIASDIAMFKRLGYEI